MKSQKSLIEYYSKQLEKVKSSFPINTKSSLINERNVEYIKVAEENLKKVKNGRNW